MAKPRSRPQLRLDAAHVADEAAGLPAGHWSRLFFEHVYCRFDDAQFAALYQDGGRYPVAPSLLAGLTILQYMFKASDRVAVDNTVMRRDWRLALGRDSAWEGFDPSVLCNFRKRLVAQGMERQLFEAVLDRLRELGLLGKRRRLRIDATHLVADVAVLSRADALREAIRGVVHDIFHHYPALHADPLFGRLHEQYGEEVWLGSPQAGAQSLGELGRDGQALVQLCGECPVKGKLVLAQMLAENFVLPNDGPPQPLDRDQRPKDHIVTPHEPDARVGKKGDLVWTGDKVHVVETADDDQPNFIVDVLSTGPRVDDTQVLAQVVEQARAALPEAGELLADGGYASAENTEVAQAAQFDLICPPRGQNSQGLLPLSGFDIDLEARSAICPAGHRNSVWSVGTRALRIRFPASLCNCCPRRAECTTSDQGRSLNLSRHYSQLMLDRARAQTDEFKDLYSKRANIEATIAHLVRDCGLRRSRYRGRAKRGLHALLAATALNVRRLLHCLGGSGSPRKGPQEALPRRVRPATDSLRSGLGAILRALRAHPAPDPLETGATT